MKKLNFLKILFFIPLALVLVLFPLKYSLPTTSIFVVQGEEQEPQCSDGWNLNNTGNCEKEIEAKELTFNNEVKTEIPVSGLILTDTENATFDATLTNQNNSTESYHLNVEKDPTNTDTLILKFNAGSQLLNGTYTLVIIATKAGNTPWGSGASINTDLPGDPDIYDGNPWTELVNRIQRILGIILMFAGIIAVVVIIVGGYNYVTAGGDAEKASHGRNAVIGAVVGLVITFAAYAIVSFVAGIL